MYLLSCKTLASRSKSSLHYILWPIVLENDVNISLGHGMWIADHDMEKPKNKLILTTLGHLCKQP